MVKIKESSTATNKKDITTTIPQFATTNNTTMSHNTMGNLDSNATYNRRRNSLILSGIFLLAFIVGIFYNQGDSSSIITNGVSNNGHNVRLRGLLPITNQVRLLDEWESEDDDDDDDSIAAVEDVDTSEEPPVVVGEDDEVLEEEAELATLAKVAVSTEMLDEEAIAALDEDEDNYSVPTLEDLSQPVVEEGEDDEDRFDINENEDTTEELTEEVAKEEALSEEEPINSATELESNTNFDLGDLEDETAAAATTENNVDPQEKTSTESVSVVEDEEEEQSEFDQEIDKESEEIFDEIEQIDEEIEGMLNSLFVFSLVVCISCENSIENIMI